MEGEERPSKMRKLSHVDQPSFDALEKAFDGKAEMQNKAPSEESGKTANNHTRESEVGQSDVPKDFDGLVSKSEGQAYGNGYLPTPEDTAPSLASTQVNSDDPPLSKNQQKKLQKKLEWESKRDERKLIRKEKTQAKRERKRAAKQQEAEASPGATAEPKKQPVVKPKQLPITIMVDCDFDDLMRDGERISLASQITRCYSDNKNSPFRAHLTICSFGGELRKRFDTILTHYKSWRGVRTFDENFVETAEKAKEWMSESQGGELAGIFSKYANLDEMAQQKLKDEGEVVYLSSEADEDLTELKPYSTYIIGGLVDKNREKGICHRRASKAGVKTARLPIGEYMEMSSRKVLATNHVNEIMVRWLECGDWGDAFMKVIPKRKGGKLKGADDEEEPIADEPADTNEVNEAE